MFFIRWRENKKKIMYAVSVTTFLFDICHLVFKNVFFITLSDEVVLDLKIITHFGAHSKN